ncbi:uncharacterized protein THITE_2058763 [Thermothielavioides terrestris NRRL 8126]|uniref:RBR-type E3 ubiquitin transferase n=1 Tax=Thermothielavioides terrestris (strain ATCC 38088 / NRRL 8126) TaxID=578455 RepID=G2RHC7_THETT|nr:uncharacterized protein THITE_2058763 [Thermothielavioides terrestris NRRL 8126]AEO71239.1 hypothetical protein THITE_2058763 [Thermothielavioides terrestris NRRL 8126]
MQDLGLALQLQREELESLKNGRKGKGREGEADDLECAIQLFEAELSSCATQASDSAMCRSIARAVVLDAELIRAITQQEEQAAQDRVLASRLSSGGMAPSTAASARRAEVVRCQDQDSDDDEQRLTELWRFNVPLDQHPAESSTWAASRPGSPSTHPSGSGRCGSEQPTIECNSCGDHRPSADVARCECGHHYCRECLATLFTLSLTDESLFPPRCCGRAIALDGCRPLLSATLAGKFLARKAEMDTPNRTYCHRPACSAFVPPPFVVADVATCVRCGKKTCAICKGAAHDGDCPHDEAVQELLRVAAENGWQRCYACHRLVELEYGCNHMTCRCKAEFCYICGAKWKTCDCPQWNEDRLLARANVIVNRDPGAQQLNDAGRANRVERERRNLVHNHECQHDNWQVRHGENRCEQCHDDLPLYIYECTQCMLLACHRCRYNRL